MHPSRPALVPTQAPIQWVPDLFPRGKLAGAWVDHPPPISPEVKERIWLYLYSHSGHLWPVLGWTLPLLTFLYIFRRTLSRSHHASCR